MKNNKKRANLLKTVEACVLAALLVAVLSVGFYHAGLNVAVGLLLGLFIVVRLLRIT
jgi:hypothetical protein